MFLYYFVRLIFRCIIIVFFSPVNIFVFLFDLSIVTSKNETISIYISSSSIFVFYPIKSKVIHRYRAIIFHSVFFSFFMYIHISFMYSLCVSSFYTRLYEVTNKIDYLYVFYCLQKKKKEEKTPFFSYFTTSAHIYFFLD